MPSYDPRRNPKDLVLIISLYDNCNMNMYTHTHTQISYMEADMDKGLANILCTKIDQYAGDWPSDSFVEFFRIAKKCVEPKMHQRPEIAQVCVHQSYVETAQPPNLLYRSTQSWRSWSQRVHVCMPHRKCTRRIGLRLFSSNRPNCMCTLQYTVTLI